MNVDKGFIGAATDIQRLQLMLSEVANLRVLTFLEGAIKGLQIAEADSASYDVPRKI